VREFYENMKPDEFIELPYGIDAGGKTYTRANRDDIVAMFQDGALAQSVRDKQAANRRDLRHYVAGSTWLDRFAHDEEYREANRLLTADHAIDLDGFTPRDLLASVEDAQLSWPSGIQIFWVLMMVVVSVFPAAWTLWPLAAGAGLSYRVMGLALVRRDGRLASRLQCFLRALLVWGPVTALGWIATGLVVFAPGLPWLSQSAGWLAGLLLLVYALAALRWPARTLHDRLVGTFAVPR
jgi:hypothetical protein